jgi:hypothetical protein
VPGQKPADVNVVQRDVRGGFLRWRCDSVLWVEGPSDPSVAVAVLREGGARKLQFTP